MIVIDFEWVFKFLEMAWSVSESVFVSVSVAVCLSVVLWGIQPFHPVSMNSVVT
jgi:hypothetical protein